MSDPLHFYIITRFSIYDTTTSCTFLQNNKDYKKILFSNDRLNFKFKVFEKITLPSINSQTYKNYTWLIYTSDILPENYKIKLIELTKSNLNIQIVYVNNFDTFKKDIPLKILKNNYMSMLLDDDDGLSIYFLQNLIKYEKNKKCIISMPKGIQFMLNNNNIIYGKKNNCKKIAIGLTANNMNIFDCGNHSKVDSKYNVIYDQLENAYLICCSIKYCDSKRPFS